MVSVPWVTTKPAGAESPCCMARMRSASERHISCVTAPDATLLNCSTVTSAISRIRGMPSTSSVPVRRLSSPRFEIVPPVAMMYTRGRAALGACATNDDALTTSTPPNNTNCTQRRTDVGTPNDSRRLPRRTIAPPALRTRPSSSSPAFRFPPERRRIAQPASRRLLFR